MLVSATQGKKLLPACNIPPLAQALPPSAHVLITFNETLNSHIPYSGKFSRVQIFAKIQFSGAF